MSQAWAEAVDNARLGVHREHLGAGAVPGWSWGTAEFSAWPGDRRRKQRALGKKCGTCPHLRSNPEARFPVRHWQGWCESSRDTASASLCTFESSLSDGSLMVLPHTPWRQQQLWGPDLLGGFMIMFSTMCGTSKPAASSSSLLGCLLVLPHVFKSHSLSSFLQ